MRSVAADPEVGRELDTGAIADTTASDRAYLLGLVDELTDELVFLRPSEWVEKHRYLPKSLTAQPGHYRFKVTPYLREIVDNLDENSPVREIVLMKSAQIGATVGILENAILYIAHHIKTAAILFVTADAELAKERLETNILPGFRHSGIADIIQSSDAGNNRKTGQTSKRVEWLGGGYLIPFGAQSSNKLRSVTVSVLLRDEIDGWPAKVGNDGDPMHLSRTRTATFEASRKILDLSTPTVKGGSKIARRYASGDQRRYMVRCLNAGCRHPQALEWLHTDPETGEVGGIHWETDTGGEAGAEQLVPGSVRYRCVKCAHEHGNDDKIRLLAENNAEWVPTAQATRPNLRSYHISALYSPVGMQTWESCVQQYLEAWDEKASEPRDIRLWQVFRNNILGLPFEAHGTKLRFDMVSPHRRHEYRYGEVPNRFASAHAGSPIQVVTCAVDVHKANLAVAVIGWTRGRRAFLLDYHRLGETETSDTANVEDASTWGELRQIIEEGEWTADDGKRYAIQLTVIDTGYRDDVVHQFCAEYARGVFAIKGRATPQKGSPSRYFSPMKTRMGGEAYSVTVDLYKDRWNNALRRQWSGIDLQPRGHFNAPTDATDTQLRELTVEVKREKLSSTGQRVGWEWHRPGGARNELWDLLIYNSAALDLLAWDVCRRQIELDKVDWSLFWDLCQRRKLFFY